MVTEYASGGSLDNRPAPRDWSGLRGLLLAVLDALAHAHAHGVVHLDLKPGNLLHCKRGDYRPGLKLTDFGLAQAISVLQAARRQRIAGTPQYMAPEQFGSDGSRIGPWSDLYALGCLGWELACGRRVFGGPSAAELRRDHMQTRPGVFKPRIRVPAGFEAWVRQLLSKTALGRFEHAADAAWALLSLGEAVDFERTTIDLGLGGAETFAFQTFAALPVMSAPDFEDALDSPTSDSTPRWTRPPTPRGWRAPLVARPVRLLHDAGSSLFGLRTMPYVGRDQLRDRLWDTLRDLDADGQARAVVLSGVSGVGKTRLATWLGRRAAELGAARFLAVHYAAEDDITALLCREFGKSADPRNRIPELQGSLADVGRSRPVVLLLDDCADAVEAASFARRVVRNRSVQPMPVLVVLTVEALTPAIEKLIELDGASHEPVKPLDADASHLLVRGLLALDEGLAGDLEFRAAGNPEYARGRPSVSRTACAGCGPSAWSPFSRCSTRRRRERSSWAPCWSPVLAATSGSRRAPMSASPPTTRASRSCCWPDSRGATKTAGSSRRHSSASCWSIGCASGTGRR
ncbi:MAG: protein kinase [Proteobacteria bacterium]|nr:protein kinase [Pseudomonadota bacterium]